MVGSSVGYLLEKSARRWCQMGSLEPFVADIWPDLPEGVLLTCDKAGAGDCQPVGVSVATVTSVRLC